MKFIGFVMILPVLVAELKLRAEFFADKALSRVKFLKSLDAMGAVIIAALIDGGLLTVFPFKEGIMAVGAIVFGFIIFTELFAELKEVTTDFA